MSGISSNDMRRPLSVKNTVDQVFMNEYKFISPL